MKFFGFLIAVVGGFMMYLGITSKKLTIGKWSFGVGKVDSTQVVSNNTNTSTENAPTPMQPDSGTYFFGDNTEVAKQPWEQATPNGTFFGGANNG